MTGRFWPGTKGDKFPPKGEENLSCSCVGTFHFDRKGDVMKNSQIFVTGYETEGKPIYPKKGLTDHFYYKASACRMEFAEGPLTGNASPNEVRWRPSQITAVENKSDVAGSEAGANGDWQSQGGVATTNGDQEETVKGEKVPSTTV
jgi:hypothetical protein